MGFFSDLKEDLAQAVSELVPEDNGKVSKVDEEALLQAAEESMGMEHKEETTSSASFEDLPSRISSKALLYDRSCAST